MSDQAKPANWIYTPAEVATVGMNAIRQLREAQLSGNVPGVGIEIADIRDYFAPMLPGQVCAVIAQTSNYKSGFLHCIEHLTAARLAAEGRDEVLIHVSVEEGVEEQAFLEFSRLSGESAGALARGNVQDWGRLEAASVRVLDIPIFRIGDSLARAEDMPQLYLSNMVRSVKELVEGRVLDGPVKPAALYFDYLQAFPIDPEVKGAAHDQQRRLQVREDVYRLRQAAAYFKCPVFVAVQAKQHLDGAPGRNMLIPGIYDGEESSSIAQRCDRIVSLWMPKQTHTLNEVIEHNNMSFRVDENLLWVKVCKQRGGLPSGKVWKCRIDFTNNQIAPEAERGAEPPRVGWAQ